jgi:hypothetical protein
MTGKLDNIKAQYEAARQNAKNDGKLFPKHSSGARSYIKLAGKPLAVCQDFRWQVSAPATEIRTIDTHLPWDSVVNQMSITATLSQIIDPSTSAESQGLFHTIQSVIHQPFVEIQALDVSGSTLFFARGMFTSVNGSISRGQLSSINATFQGVMYQGNVYQEFEPYTESELLGKLESAVGSVYKNLKKFSGGFL